MELFLKPAPEYRENQRDRVLRLRWVGEGTIWRRWKFWAVQLIRQTDKPMSCFHIRCFPVCVYMETMPLLFAPHHLCHCCCSCSTPVLGRAPSISTPSRNRRYLNLIYPPPPPPQNLNRTPQIHFSSQFTPCTNFKRCSTKNNTYSRAAPWSDSAHVAPLGCLIISRWKRGQNQRFLLATCIPS